MKGPLKTVPEFVAQVVKACRERCHDRALFASDIPKSTGHRTRRWRNRNARDSGAVFITISPNQVLDFGVCQNTLFLRQWREPDRVHLRRFDGHGFATHQCQKTEDETTIPETAKSCFGLPGRWPEHQRPCRQCKNKWPSCEWLVCDVVTIVQRALAKCQ